MCLLCSLPGQVRQKLDEKSIKCIFLGIDPIKNGYRCFDANNEKFYVSRSVKFDEMRNWKKMEFDEEIYLTSGVHQNEEEKKENNGTEQEKQEEKGKQHESDINHETSTLELRRSTRIRKPTERLTYESFIAQHYLFMAKVNEYTEPTDFEDASQKPKWKNAMKEEIDALQKNDTWELVPKMTGQKVIGCKWVYKTKFNSDGTLNRCKARLVAKGYSQTYGIDYDETFSPVAKMASIRVVISLASSLNWTLHQMDVNNAFLNGFLKEEVFMEQPEGFKDSANPEFVCKLKRGLYGLKQAPRRWFERLANYLKIVGFKQSLADASVFIMNGKNDIIIIVLYVDDLIITSSNDGLIYETKMKLSAQFEMKD